MIAFLSHPLTACFAGRPVADVESRFWSKVDRTYDPTRCWPWLASRYKDGYGQFFVGGKLVRAHRFAYALVNGPIPSGLVVCHRCDVRHCCNPAHLFLGSKRDNTQDMCRKGRQASGVRHGHAKLTPDQVREIREATGTHEEIGRQFNTHRANVSYIRTGKTWKQPTAHEVAT